MRQFSPKQLQEHLETGKDTTLLLDVREPWEFEICHIADSTLIPMGEVPFRAEELDKANTIVVICHHGVRSRYVCMYLERAGFENVVNLSGGVEAWARDVAPDMATY